jgi:hypothetical protein
MNKHLVLLAAVSMLFSACGNSEEPKISQPATGERGPGDGVRDG